MILSFTPKNKQETEKKKSLEVKKPTHIQDPSYIHKNNARNSLYKLLWAKHLFFQVFDNSQLSTEVMRL